ncbi:MAG: hypothetical protein ABSG96_03530 [Terracidiphilus sp.]
MREFIFALLLASSALSGFAQKSSTPKSDAPEKVTVVQLEQALLASSGKSDAETVQALTRLELTERLSGARFAHLKANLPGEKSQQALLILADQSAFLPPPDNEVVQEAAPDAAATRQMLVQIVNYVNNTVRQLPNLMAVRETTSFEDRPASDSLESTGVVSLSYLPIHFVGKSNVAVSYRDRKEVVDEGATKSLKQAGLKEGGTIVGMTTSGEFGPFLSAVVGDALKGRITWKRWEQDAGAKLAVFNIEVPDAKSNYYVKFCCVPNGFTSTGQADLKVFNERASYHGEITFNPADGSILRLTIQAEMPPKGLVPNAGIALEYGSVEIGGKSYICPAKSVSFYQAHIAMQQGMTSNTNFQGPAKTYLNDVEFIQYRRFGSETRIFAGDNQPSQ